MMCYVHPRLVFDFDIFRLKDADKKKNNLLTTFKRNERDKKKLIETVLKQLRQLSNGQVQHT